MQDPTSMAAPAIEYPERSISHRAWRTGCSTKWLAEMVGEVLQAKGKGPAFGTR